jgi:hypothetical protein
MSYEGRSPIKDVVRSVVMSAAMVSPGLLAACAGPQTGNPIPVPLDPLGGADGGTSGADPNGLDAATGSSPIAVDPTSPPTVPTAPPTATVRPRTPPTGTQMPTRGFAGAVRARS